MKNKERLHIGCGDIYLSPNYINIDIKGLLVTEATKEELEKNKTNIEHYFKYPFGSARREVIIDKKMNLLKKWDFEDNSIKEIVAVSILEHFFLDDIKFIISEIKRVLIKNGVLIIDFPDIKNTVKKYYDTNPEFMSRLIYCNAKDIYSIHRTIITPKLFKSFWEDKYSIYEDTIVKHDYPTLSYIVIKNV